MGIVVSPCLSAFILVTNTSPNATCLTPTPQQARAPPREQSGPAKLRLVGSSVHSPRLLHGVMHVARPSASVSSSSRSSVGAVSREPVQGVALFCPPAVARPSLRPPSVRVCRKDAAVVTVATQCLTTLSWAVWPRCPPAKTCALTLSPQQARAPSREMRRSFLPDQTHRTGFIRENAERKIQVWLYARSSRRYPHSILTQPPQHLNSSRSQPSQLIRPRHR